MMVFFISVFLVFCYVSETKKTTKLSKNYKSNTNRFILIVLPRVQVKLSDFCPLIVTRGLNMLHFVTSRISHVQPL